MPTSIIFASGPSYVSLWALLAVSLGCTLVWAVSVIVRNAAIIDMFWGMAFVVIAWIALAQVQDPSGPAWLICGATTVWGLRLSLYLGWRTVGKAEDFRYQAMREKAPDRFWITSLPKVFLLQAGLAWLISVPLQAGILTSESRAPFVVGLGVTFWSIGLFFETVGDFQLARFKSAPENAGKVLRRGLWRFTRHPNYFGDAMIWWGFYLMSATPHTWWWTWLGPFLMTFFLVRISGVTMLERALVTRVDGYTDYVRSTSAFVPWPPKSSNAS